MPPAFFPLTPTQRDLYLDIERHADSTTHSPALSIILDSSVNPELWRTAVRHAVEADSTTRLRFGTIEDEGTQRLIDRSSDVLTSLHAEGTETQEALISRVMAPFDLAHGPLVRHALYRLENGEHMAILGMAHLIADGHTFRLLFERAGRHYEALAGNREAPEEPSRTFVDYLAGATPSIPPDSEPFWKPRLEAVAPLIFTTPSASQGVFAHSALSLPEQTVSDLRKYCKDSGFSVSVFFLALSALVLQAFRERNGAWILHAIKGSRPPAFRHALGCFFHVVPYLFDDRHFARDFPVAELFREVAAYRRSLAEHQYFPMLEQHNLLPAGGSRLIYNYYDFDQAHVLGRRRPLTVHMAHTPSETHIIVSDRQEGIDLRHRFHTSTFNDRTVPRRLAQVAEQVLGGAHTLKDIDWLLPEERAIRIDPSPVTDHETISVHGLFERQVFRAPSRIALTEEARHWTYEELNAWANDIAHTLRNAQVGPESRVGLFLDRSALQVASILGVLKAGGAYVPIDPDYPAERIQFILGDSGVRLVLTTSVLVNRLPFNQARSVLLEPLPSAPPSVPNPCSLPADPASLAYVIYTSGSTGKPKGVEVTHRNLARLFSATARDFEFGPDDVWPLLHSYAFDFSVWELWGALTYGGRLVVVPLKTLRAPDALRELLNREKVTVLNQTPSAFYRLIQADSMAGAPLLNALRFVIFGGEALDLARLRPWAERYGVSRPVLVNMYGITETTVHVTFRRLSQSDLDDPRGSMIGCPLSDLQVYLVDPEGRPVPQGVPGEIWVGGAGVARGYLNRAELTQERFPSDPFSDSPGARVYRSGDLARRLPDGDLEYLGRIDQQIKIRGYRVELGEIESVLRQHPSVSEAAVIANRGGDGDPVLIGYAVVSANRTTTEAQLIHHLQLQLPSYMVCTRILLLPALPLTPHGKLDRRALPLPDAVPLQTAVAWAAPRTPVEEILVNIFAEVTGHVRVGIHDDFFLLGGHSLSSIRLAARVRELLGRNIRIGLVFDHATPATLATAIERQTLADDETPEPEFVQRPSIFEFPLTYPQERVWLIQHLNPDSTAYHFEAAIRFHGRLNADLLEQTLGFLVQRHSVLRTTFHEVDGRLIQRIHERGPVSLRRFDVSNQPDPAAHIEQWRLDCAPRPFALDKLPLIEWTLFTTGPNDHVLLHREHHLLHDGWSFIILLGELLTIYAASVRNQPPSLPHQPIRLGEFAEAQRRWVESGALRKQEDFWRGQLQNGPEALGLPLDRPRGARLSQAGGVLRFDLPPELVEGMKDFSRRNGTTLFMTALSVFSTLMGRYANQTDFCIGSGAANRRWKETEHLVGMLLNNVVFRLRSRKSPTLREWVQEVRTVVMQALNHQDLPFERMVQLAGIPRNPAMPPLCQVFFSSYDGAFPCLHLPGLEVDFEAGLANGGAKFDLNVILIVEPGAADAPDSPGLERVSLIWEYNRDLFDAATMTRMTHHFVTLLRRSLAAPDVPMDRLELADEDERSRLTALSSGPIVPYPRDVTVSGLFEQQAERTPEKIAVRAGNVAWSYTELNRQANRLAHRLRARGTQPGEVVGFCLDRGLRAIQSLLGILKSGAAYLPLDPQYPPDRLALLAKEAGIRTVVTEDRFLPLLGGCHGISLISLDVPSAESDPAADRNAPAVTHADGLAYVLFTSGSTGRPKAVEVPHRGISRLVLGADYVHLDDKERILQMAPLSFDASTFEIWAPLLHGGEMVVLGQPSLSPLDIGQAIAKHGITTLWLNGSLFNLVMDERPEALRPLRQLLIGGETLSVPHVRRACEKLPHTRIVNGYGPTENTTFSCCYSIPPKLPSVMGSIPIGRPIANSFAWILDPQGLPCAIGVPGEICVGGDGLARGYRGRPEATGESFVSGPEGRRYRTGDIGRWLESGVIEFRGRRDGQMKIRGYRIEPGEVEQAILQTGGIRQAAVLAEDDGHGGKRLVAYCIANADAKTTPSDVRAGIRTLLPAHMIPQIVLVDAFPLTVHGKLDRAALRARGATMEPPAATGDSPRNTHELVLQGIFRDLLHRNEIGIHDDFFASGGHSLMAMRLIARIHQNTGIRLSARALFDRPTIAGLASAMTQIEQGETSASFDAARWSYLVPVQEGERAPLFFAVGGDGAEGSILVYARLARHLAPDRPFYCFKAAGMKDGGKPHASVEAMAADYVRELRQVQPCGPYSLAGGCIGGVIAYEMARQLTAAGERVRRVVLLDTTYPSTRTYARQLVRGACTHLRFGVLFALFGADFARELARRLQAEQATARLPADWARTAVSPRFFLRQVGRQALIRCFGRRPGEVTTPGATGFYDSLPALGPRRYRFYLQALRWLPFSHEQADPGVLSVWIRYANTLHRYRPKPYHGRVDLLVCEEVAATGVAEKWRTLVGPSLLVHTVPGTHDTYIRSGISTTGDLLNRILEDPS